MVMKKWSLTFYMAITGENASGGDRFLFEMERHIPTAIITVGFPQ